MNTAGLIPNSVKIRYMDFVGRKVSILTEIESLILRNQDGQNENS